AQVHRGSRRSPQRRRRAEHRGDRRVLRRASKARAEHVAAVMRRSPTQPSLAQIQRELRRGAPKRLWREGGALLSVLLSLAGMAQVPPARPAAPALSDPVVGNWRGTLAV